MDDLDEQTDLAHERLYEAGEKLRLAAVALSRLAELTEATDDMLEPHVERLECRADELMRATRRLAADMGLAGRWGMDILFASDDSTQGPAAMPTPDDSVELEPFELLDPVSVPPPPRAPHASRPPWGPSVVLPTPPLASMSADRALDPAPVQMRVL